MSPFLGTRGAGSNRAFGYAGAAAPAQVTGLTATDFGTSRAYNNGRIDLSWNTPANNGATISGYLIERSTDGSSYSTLVANTGSATTTYSDTSLSSAQIYYYKVSAINVVGTGLASTAANATATTVPQAPTIGTATAGDASATVTYTANATGGKTVSTFTATSNPGSITGTGSSPITVSGLTNGTAYTFTITATNANGTSSASAASNSVTPEIPSNFYNIATASGGSTVATISSIPSGYKYYVVRAICQSSGSGIADLAVRINGGTATNYRNIVLQPTDSGNNNLGSDSTNTYFQSALSGTSQNGWTVIYMLFSAENANEWITGNTWGALTRTASSSSAQIILGACQYQTTSALSSISFENWNGTAFSTGSSFALYGVN